jgi:hypothetical protein
MSVREDLFALVKVAASGFASRARWAFCSLAQVQEALGSIWHGITALRFSGGPNTSEACDRMPEKRQQYN